MKNGRNGATISSISQNIIESQVVLDRNTFKVVYCCKLELDDESPLLRRSNQPYGSGVPRYREGLSEMIASVFLFFCILYCCDDVYSRQFIAIDKRPVL